MISRFVRNYIGSENKHVCHASTIWSGARYYGERDPDRSRNENQTSSGDELNLRSKLVNSVSFDGLLDSRGRARLYTRLFCLPPKSATTLQFITNVSPSPFPSSPANIQTSSNSESIWQIGLYRPG